MFCKYPEKIKLNSLFGKKKQTTIITASGKVHRLILKFKRAQVWGETRWSQSISLQIFTNYKGWEGDKRTKNGEEPQAEGTPCTKPWASRELGCLRRWRTDHQDLEENPKSMASSVTATTIAFHIGAPNAPTQRWWIKPSPPLPPGQPPPPM